MLRCGTPKKKSCQHCYREKKLKKGNARIRALMVQRIFHLYNKILKILNAQYFINLVVKMLTISQISIN